MGLRPKKGLSPYIIVPTIDQRLRCSFQGLPSLWYPDFSQNPSWSSTSSVQSSGQASVVSGPSQTPSPHFYFEPKVDPCELLSLDGPSGSWALEGNEHPVHIIRNKINPINILRLIRSPLFWSLLFCVLIHTLNFIKGSTRNNQGQCYLINLQNVLAKVNLFYCCNETEVHPKSRNSLAYFFIKFTEKNLHAFFLQPLQFTAYHFCNW